MARKGWREQGEDAHLPYPRSRLRPGAKRATTEEEEVRRGGPPGLSFPIPEALADVQGRKPGALARELSCGWKTGGDRERNRRGEGTKRESSQVLEVLFIQRNRKLWGGSGKWEMGQQGQGGVQSGVGVGEEPPGEV